MPLQQSAAETLVPSLALGILVVLLFISVLVLFCAVLIKLYTKKIKKYVQLMFEKEIESQKAITRATVETQEQVLNDISQDLHDDAGQQLTYINFQIENLKLDSPELRDKLEPVSQSLVQLSASVRSISHSLSNQLLLQQNLFKAIKSEVERLTKNSTLNARVSIREKQPREFNQSQTIIIYRIFQEVIANALKHGKATKIQVNLQGEPFEMIITDDGRGFDTKNVNGDSLGITGMKRRAESIGFDFSIDSNPGKGATARLTEKTST